MANDRISRATAELVPMPPHTWYVRSINWLLEQEKVKENILSVPYNTNLAHSLYNHGMVSPILVMPNWYPIAGSQRLRAMAELVKAGRSASRCSQSAQRLALVVGFAIPNASSVESNS